MHFDQGLADRQPQPQPAKLLRDRALRLLEGVEDPPLRLRLDPDPVVVHLGDHVILIPSAVDACASAVGRNLMAFFNRFQKTCWRRGTSAAIQ